MVVHNIPPVFDKNSEILILGSFPSVKSRETKFFYGHKQNRFWKIVAEIFDCTVPQTVNEKKRFLIENHIALWDVIAQCEITGSSDLSIKNAEANNLDIILNSANIKKIFVNGKTAEKYYNKYLFEKTGINAVCLPSTSPANASYSIEELKNEWTKIKL
ncbi:MAG: DNA-deoxyinosine glycosylase [Clostridia bacterium]|nr:DNA-deoxyinosine glycosylase [Clostridia bacterium]